MTGHVVPNSIVLMFVRGWQGGTCTMIADELGVTCDDIESATNDRMGELMRLAQMKLVTEIRSGKQPPVDRDDGPRAIIDVDVPSLGPGFFKVGNDAPGFIRRVRK